MNRIVEHLCDPVWWFNAVFIAMLAGIAGAFLKDALLTSLSKISKAIRVRKERRDRSDEEGAEVLARNQTLFILTFCDLLLRFLILAVMGTIFIGTYICFLVIDPMTGGDLMVKLFFGFLSVLSGAFCALICFDLSPRMRVTSLAYRTYRRALLENKAQQASPSDPNKSAIGGPYI